MLREKRPIELAQLPIRHVRLCGVVVAAHTRARQYRGYVQSLGDGRESTMGAKMITKIILETNSICNCHFQHN